MKLYFYSMNANERYKKVGITVQVCEAEEKNKTYKSVDGTFPNYSSIVRKDDEGRILHFNFLFLTEPNFEYAKKKFIELSKSKLAVLKESLESEERKLKLIEESEE